MGAAVLLPLAVPAVVTSALWLLPGSPAENVCAREICGAATDQLATDWHLDQGATHFYTWWLGNAVQGDFGTSWSVMSGVQVSDLLWESLPVTAMMIALALIPLAVGTFATALGWLPRRLDGVWQAIGLMPAVILALFLAARVEIHYGAGSYDGWPGTLRILCGALVLGLADGALSGAVTGTRAVFEEEMKQRYIQIALLRGETPLSNALPNVLPALIGQLRGRVLHIMSGAVIVEVVMGLSGVGELLFLGTLTKDFAVVLAAAWGFSLLSASLLFVQALSEVALALFIRRSPSGVAEATS